MQVVSVHDCSLKELDLSEVTFEQSFQLQVRLLPAVNNTTAASFTSGMLRPRSGLGLEINKNWPRICGHYGLGLVAFGLDASLFRLEFFAFCCGMSLVQITNASVLQYESNY